jgi:hypothetical protein
VNQFTKAAVARFVMPLCVKYPRLAIQSPEKEDFPTAYRKSVQPH